MSQEIDTILSTLRMEVDPELAPLFYEFEEYYERKLWHQLTDRLELLFQDERSVPVRLRVYLNFISKFQDKINQLKVVNFLLLSIKDNNNYEENLNFLNDLKNSFHEIDAKKQRNDGLKSHFEGILLIDIEMARTYLRMKDLSRARDLLNDISETLDNKDSIPLMVTGAFYSTNAEYYHLKNDFNSYYYTSLLYLSALDSVVPSLTHLEQQKLAYNLCIAALLGDKIYNFGELLQHPIMSSISGDEEYRCLFQFLHALSVGDFDRFGKLTQESIPKIPILAKNESFLRQKICLITLVESLFAKSIRTLSFDDIAKATHLPKDNVEHLVMKSISLGLLKGSIDHVEELVTITWVQPRIINEVQINKMKHRLMEWDQEVTKLSEKIEKSGKGIWV